MSTLLMMLLLVAFLIGASEPAKPDFLDCSVVPYKRSEWHHWIDEDNDCQNTRHEVLRRDARGMLVLTGDNCKVLSGKWQDPYSLEIITDPSKLDIDHLVPLANAHRSGGCRWNVAQKRKFANDLSNKKHLLAVKASLNRQKGSRGPDLWLPPRRDARYQYVRDYLQVKVKYDLTLTAQEAKAIVDIVDNYNDGYSWCIPNDLLPKEEKP